jgi:hypothetical protein
MKNTFIRVISMVLTVALLLCAAVPVLAEEYEDEEYLSDLPSAFKTDTYSSIIPEEEKHERTESL